MYRGHIQRTRKRKAPQFEIAEKYSLDIPFTFKEADAVDSTGSDGIFVVEFNGAANTNEVGVGAGLSATDRVLTQSGGVPGAVDGWREVLAADYFNCTPAFMNSICRSTAGFTMAWKIKDAAAFNSSLVFLGQHTTAGCGHIAFEPRDAHRWISSFGALADGYRIYQGDFHNYPDDISVGEWYAVCSYDPVNYGAVLGMARNFPMHMLDFDHLMFLTKMNFNVVTPYATMDWSINTRIFGTAVAGGAKIAGFMAARRPCFVLNS